VIAGLLILIGIVFAGQGLGYIPGSFMTGEIRWFWIGLAMVLGGGALAAAIAFYRGGAGSAPPPS
jgi:hypothetical protein